MGDMERKKKIMSKRPKPKAIRYFIKSRTGGGDRAKQYFTAYHKAGIGNTLVVRKLVLTQDFDDYAEDFDCLKEYKGWYLFEKWFSWRLETLVTALLAGSEAWKGFSFKKK